MLDVLGRPPNRPRWPLELGPFIALSAPAQGSGPQVLPSPPSVSPFSRTLLCSSFPGGDDWASGGAIYHVFAQPFPGDEHPQGMPAPSLSFCCARRSTPNPNKTIFVRIWIQFNILPTNFDVVCKSYRVYSVLCWVRPLVQLICCCVILWVVYIQSFERCDLLMFWLFFTCQFEPCILEWLDLLAKNLNIAEFLWCRCP